MKNSSLFKGLFVLTVIDIDILIVRAQRVRLFQIDDRDIIVFEEVVFNAGCHRGRKIDTAFTSIITKRFFAVCSCSNSFYMIVVCLFMYSYSYSIGFSEV